MQRSSSTASRAPSTFGNYASALRDQIRVCLHVSKMADLPAIGAGSSDAELRRLEEAVDGFFAAAAKARNAEPRVPPFPPCPDRTSA